MISAGAFTCSPWLARPNSSVSSSASPGVPARARALPLASAGHSRASRCRRTSQSVNKSSRRFRYSSCGSSPFVVACPDIRPPVRRPRKVPHQRRYRRSQLRRANAGASVGRVIDGDGEIPHGHTFTVSVIHNVAPGRRRARSRRGRFLTCPFPDILPVVDLAGAIMCPAVV